MADDGDTHGEGGPASEWSKVAERLLGMWDEYRAGQSGGAREPSTYFLDPAKWVQAAEQLFGRHPIQDPAKQAQLWEEGLGLFEAVLGQYGIGPATRAEESNEPQLPRSDRRFSDPAWRETPFFALLHQAYLLGSERLVEMAEQAEGLDPAKQAQMAFATRLVTDALSPANFPMTNPVAMNRAAETKGESLVAGMEHFLTDLAHGQLTQTRPDTFTVGEDVANTPGKVIHETPLFQLIQYTPTTDKVLKTPLVIFPPWINRFYILDLGEKKSFVRWIVDQGITLFMVSWKSADASLADVTMDDYVAAQVETIDVVCARLKVPSAHVIGYCVAGSTLAATLAILARRGEAGKVRSATFLTTQVDFEEAGDLKHFSDSVQIDAIEQLATDGYIDGRYLAATFNLLRGNDLVWRYVVENYLKGEDYRSFDMLHWNGDVTNLPAKWHIAYLRDHYRDNRLVVPDSLEVCGTPVDIGLIETPSFIQAGREDHIAPPQSVWKLTRYLSGPFEFVLAGSGHIAGVVNPPSGGKYQYWTNGSGAETLDEFIAGATEHPGSWWPHWLAWLKSHDPAEIRATGKRKPGGRGDKVLGEAPGSYVKMR